MKTSMANPLCANCGHHRSQHYNGRGMCEVTALSTGEGGVTCHCKQFKARTPQKKQPTYLIVPSRDPAYVFQGRMTVTMRGRISDDGAHLFRINPLGRVSIMEMTGHFTEKDPWEFAALPRKPFNPQREGD